MGIVVSHPARNAKRRSFDSLRSLRRTERMGHPALRTDERRFVSRPVMQKAIAQRKGFTTGAAED